jgi:signal transduction histidine kinase
MAHEIRGPLCAARLALEHALSVGGRQGVVGDMVHRAWRELDVLGNLVERLFTWGVGLDRITPSRVDFALLIREAVESSVLETGQDRVDVSIAGRLMVDADPVELRAAVANVVRNALMYSPADTRVDVAAAVDGRQAVLRIADEGPGISAAEKEIIFGAFVQGDLGRASGGGIGLFMARSIIEGLGGSISCESNGEGSVFQIRLPLGSEGVSSSAS